MSDQAGNEGAAAAPARPAAERAKLFEGARTHWRFVMKFILFSIIFWLAEFAYQFYVLIPGELAGSLVRSFALSGATFFGFALFSSAIFKWKPKYGRYWYVRRSFGVMGFTFILFHVLAVAGFLFQWNITGFVWSLNPITNPVIFGLLAFPVFFVMALTSTDWAVDRLGYPKWKAIHRLVYFGYLFAVFHFLTINPELLMNPAGYLLIGITALTLAGQLFWFVQTVRKKKSSPLGIAVGIFVIFLWLFLGYLIFVAPALMERQQSNETGKPLIDGQQNGRTGEQEMIGEQDDLQQAIEEMMQFMAENQLPMPDMVTPEEQELEGAVLKSGTFQNVNYMSSGSASIIQEDGRRYVMFGEDFSTPNGPDLVVYLTPNTGPTTRDDIRAGIELGELRSLEGKQAYEIPSEVNIDVYNSVSVHCRAFNVPWSYAPLE